MQWGSVQGTTSLAFVPNQYKTQEMCNEAMCKNPATFFYVPERFKTQDMCKKAVEKDPRMLKYVFDHFKAGSSWRWEIRDGKFFLTTWYAVIKNVFIKTDVEIWSKRGYD